MPFPVVILRHRGRLPLLAVCFQAQRNAFRTSDFPVFLTAFLFVLIFPDLSDIDTDPYRGMRVCNRISALRITGDSIRIGTFPVGSGDDAVCLFLYGISDSLPILCFLIEIREGTGPLTALGQVQCLARILAVCQQPDRDRFRAYPILVFFVLPDLADRDLGLPGLFIDPVGHVISVYLGCVPIHSILCDGIGDLLVIFLLRKILETPLPAVCFGYGDALLFFAVCLQADRDGGGPFPLAVVIILPGLAALYCDLLRNMRIDDIVVIHSGFVALDRILLQRILDLFAFVILLRQVFKVIFPFSCLRRVSFGNLLPITVQMHRDLLRTKALQIVLILPDLLSGDRNLVPCRVPGVDQVQPILFDGIVILVLIIVRPLLGGNIV